MIILSYLAGYSTATTLKFSSYKNWSRRDFLSLCHWWQLHSISHTLGRWKPSNIYFPFFSMQDEPITAGRWYVVAKSHLDVFSSKESVAWGNCLFPLSALSRPLQASYISLFSQDKARPGGYQEETKRGIKGLPVSKEIEKLCPATPPCWPSLNKFGDKLACCGSDLNLCKKVMWKAYRNYNVFFHWQT